MPTIPVVESGWENLDIETIPLLNMPPLTDIVQQTLARLMGWNASSKAFRRVAVDESGRLLISSGQALQGQVSDNSFSAGATATIALPSNVNRILYLIQNTGINNIFLGFDSTLSVSNGLLIPVNGTWTDELYRGDVWVITTSGSQFIYTAEYSLNA